MAQAREANDITLEEFKSRVVEYNKQIRQYIHNIPHNIQEMHAAFCAFVNESRLNHPGFTELDIEIRRVYFAADFLIKRFNKSAAAKSDEERDSDSIPDYCMSYTGEMRVVGDFHEEQASTQPE